MRRAAIALTAMTGGAQAQPTTEVVSCPFDGAAMAAALVLEEQAAGKPNPGGTVSVVCASEGAKVTVTIGGRAQAREIVLVDVPAALAPRVVALVVVGIWGETGDGDGDGNQGTGNGERRTGNGKQATGATGTTGTGTGTDVVAAPGAVTAPGADAATVAVGAASRPSLIRDGLTRRATGVTARGFGRLHDGQTALWGASAAIEVGAMRAGVVGAGAQVEATLGTVTPWMFGVIGGVTVACSGAACVGVQGEVGRVAVQASASDPMVSARAIAAMYLHAAVEVSMSARLAGIEVAAVAALGSSRGVIARADDEAAAVVAGWTLGGAIEVRR